DHPDVLVVDLHALQPVDLLDLVEQVLLHGPGALDAQDVVRVHRALAEPVARTDLVALVDPEVLADGDLVHTLRPLRRDHDDLALAALDLAEPDRAVELGDAGGILGPARLDQLRDPGQPARDVARLVDLAADLGQRGPRLDELSVTHRELRAHGDDELAELLVPLGRPDLDHRVQLLLAVLDDHELPAAGRLIQLLADRLLLDDVHELDAPGEVRDDRLGIRVPTEEEVARLHVRPVLDGKGRAVGHGQTAPDGALPGAHHDLALAAGHDPVAARGRHVRDALEADLAVHLGLALRLRRDAGGRAADVEGPERELRAGLADGLRREDTHGLAQVHHLHGRQVAAVAHPAQPALGLAGQHGADLDRLDAGVLDRFRLLRVDQLARLDQQLAVDRVVDVIQRHVADDAVLERLDDVFALLERRHLDTQDRAAVLLRDRDVLRRVHEAARAVTGIRGLERGRRRPLAGAGRRDVVR